MDVIKMGSKERGCEDVDWIYQFLILTSGRFLFLFVVYLATLSLDRSYIAERWND
jgi:hypothetical protein